MLLLPLQAKVGKVSKQMSRSHGSRRIDGKLGTVYCPCHILFTQLSPALDSEVLVVCLYPLIILCPSFYLTGIKMLDQWLLSKC